MDKSDTRNTLNKLRECIARFGLPDLIFSDNGTQFTSEEFTEFCKKNGIRFQTSPPGHPESNGAAENSVKTFKRSLSKLLSDSRNKGCCMDTLVEKLLFSYRNTPHSVTGVPPSQMMFNRHIKTRLDFLTRNDVEDEMSKQIKFFRGNREIEFKIGDVVFVQDFRNKKIGWTKAIIMERLGNRVYVCVPNDDSRLSWKRHVDQIISTSIMIESEDVQSRYNENVIDNTNDCISAPNIVFPKDSDLDKEHCNINKKNIMLESTKVSEDYVRDEEKNVPIERVLRPREKIKKPDRLNL
ncbi:uncharacterized protein K02A2.6-like [Harmonia axyridis]|uniref:uncharacterized protein K02A2.6-like n=1 Tax=Harmonia axyridis TaxID=115357 RepID=UPI001E2769C9|nr:uncharacterized protein K02A2.6-like [Harmonia axyridis]